MKQLTCEMCGSTDLIKQDGVFICQSCGTKYSVEEAKRMMVEGTVDVSGSTVKVDNSERLENLYKLARQAKESNDNANAEKYYEMIKLEVPDDWEANFFSAYHHAMQTTIARIENAVIGLSNTLEGVLSMTEKLENYDERKSAVVTISGYLVIFANVIEKSSRAAFKSASDNASTSSFMMNRFLEYVARTTAVYSMLFNFANSVSDLYSHDEDMLKAMNVLYKLGIQFAIDHNDMFDDKEDKYNNLDELYAEKVRKLEPDYYIPKPNREGFPGMFKTVMENRQYNPSNNPNYVSPNTSSGGCYVATAVYGSYDCPPVWTLRRFRDYTLAATWYGRTFIRVYYSISPSLVRWFGNADWFKNVCKPSLDKLVKRLNEQGIINTPYNDKDWL